MGSRHRTPTVQNKNATRDIQGKVSCRLSVIILKCQTHRPFHRSARPPTTIVFHSGSSSRPCFIYVQHPARVSTILQSAFTKTVVRASVAFFRLHPLECLYHTGRHQLVAATLQGMVASGNMHKCDDFHDAGPPRY